MLKSLDTNLQASKKVLTYKGMIANYVADFSCGRGFYGIYNIILYNLGGGRILGSFLSIDFLASIFFAIALASKIAVRLRMTMH